MSEMACSSIVIVHPSRLFSEALADVVNTAPLKLEYVATDVDCVPFGMAAELPVTWRITCAVSKNASAVRASSVLMITGVMEPNRPFRPRK